MKSKKTLYLFDFDGTLTNRDSLFDFMKFVSSPIQYYWKFLLFLPNFIFAYVGIYKNSEIKEKFIAAFLKGKSKKETEILAKNYSQSIEEIMRPNAKKLLQSLKNDENSIVYIVSASLDIWLQPIAEKFKANLICTQSLYENEIYTGSFSSPNCNFHEKKKRILEKINPKEFKKIIAYGDSKGDLAMFSLADETHFRPFR
jgi:phosphatidylglycerophosphatase C